MNNQNLEIIREMKRKKSTKEWKVMKRTKNKKKEKVKDITLGKSGRINEIT